MGGRGMREPVLPASHVPARSSKQSKNSKVQPGLPGCHEDVFICQDGKIEHLLFNSLLV